MEKEHNNYRGGRRSMHHCAAGTYSSHECNFVGNYYKPGPSTPNNNYFMELSGARSGKTLNPNPSRWYFADNVMEGNSNATNDNWSAIHNNTTYTVAGMKSETLVYPSSEVTRLDKCKFEDYDLYRTPTESAEEAYEHVLAKAGTIRRDVTEQRIVDEVRNKQALYKGTTLKKAGFIDSPDDAEGWPTYDVGLPVVDNDHDGMADDWEVTNGFNPADPEDGKLVVSTEGYTALEVYLNSLMGEHIAITPTAIRTVCSTASDVVRRQFFTSDGRQVSRLQHGVNIVRELLADGTTRTTKVVAK